MAVLFPFAPTVSDGASGSTIMGCDFPIAAYRTGEKTPAGKRSLTFNPKHALDSSTGRIDIPCGQCTGCRLERSQQWATRMMHESQLHEFNCFITLTYSDEAIPQNYSLDLSHGRNFMKRLRWHAAYHHEGLQLRFYLAGEYGDKFGRPHYHAAIFGYDFPDKILLKKNDQGQPIFTSEILSTLWPHGSSSTAGLDYDSAAYIARYCVKKIGGEKAADHYHRLSPIDGQFHNVRPEYATMSRRPGIGAGWLDKFKGDVFPSGFIVINGKPQSPPRFYVNRLTKEEQDALKRQSKRRAIRHKDEKTNRRRFAKATVRDARISKLKRDGEFK